MMNNNFEENRTASLSSAHRAFLTPDLSFGQKLVDVRFNPSGMGEVDVLKQFFAQHIDDIHETGVSDPVVALVKEEAIRALATACMLTVKFHVKK